MHADKLNIPEGHDPAEFLNDAELAEYHAHQAATAAPDDPALPDLQRAARQSARAAAMTAEAVAEATASAEAELVETVKKPK